MKKINASELIVTRDQTVSYAMNVINEGAVGACIVVEKNQQFYGIVTDGDLRRSLLSGSKLHDQVYKITNTKAVTVDEQANHNQVLSLFNEKIRHIPVLNNKDHVIYLYYFIARTEIPVARPSLDGNELKYLTECITENWISSKGKFIEIFEKQFSEYCGCKYALAVSNGTVALHLALVSLGIGTGDEVLIPSLTFIATANAVAYTGAKPVFIDSELDTWNIDPQKLELAITVNTKAIIPVHLYGQPAQLKTITEVAVKHKLQVIEDAAEAHGAKFMGKMVGSIGDIGCFSFFGNKIITTGEGGMLVTNNKKIYEKAKILRDHGMSTNKKYWHDVIGFNYRMTNMQAAIGCAQMEKIDNILENKKWIAKIYKKNLTQIKGIILPTENDWSENVYWMYPININLYDTDNEAIRDHVLLALEEEGIEGRPFFFPVHIMPPYQSESPLELINVEKLSKNGLVLPSYLGIKEEDIEKICQIIASEVVSLSI